MKPHKTRLIVLIRVQALLAEFLWNLHTHTHTHTSESYPQPDLCSSITRAYERNRCSSWHARICACLYERLPRCNSFALQQSR